MERKLSFWNVSSSQDSPPPDTRSPSPSSLQAPNNLCVRQRKLTPAINEFQPGRRRSQRRPSSAHRAELVEHKEEVTLLSFARDVRTAYHRVASGLCKCAKTLFLKPKRRRVLVVSESDVMDQVSILNFFFFYC